jgi:hypothetical protein
MVYRVNSSSPTFAAYEYSKFLRKFNNWLLMKDEAEGMFLRRPYHSEGGPRPTGPSPLPSTRRDLPPLQRPTVEAEADDFSTPSSTIVKSPYYKGQKAYLEAAKRFKEKERRQRRYEAPVAPQPKRPKEEHFHLEDIARGEIVRVVDRDTRKEYVAWIDKEGELHVEAKREVKGVTKGEAYICTMRKGDVLHLNGYRLVLQADGLDVQEEREISFGRALWKAYDAIARKIINDEGRGGFIYKGLYGKELSILEGSTLQEIKEQVDELLGGTSYWGLSAEDTEEVADKARSILANYLYDFLQGRDLSQYARFGEDLSKLTLDRDDLDEGLTKEEGESSNGPPEPSLQEEEPEGAESKDGAASTSPFLRPLEYGYALYSRISNGLSGFNGASFSHEYVI